MKEQEPNRNGKKVNLRVWMGIVGIDIIVALMLLLYYWIYMSTDYKSDYLLVFLLMVVIILIFRRKTEGFEEFAKETLYKTDLICLRASYIIMAIILMLIASFTPSGVIIGYLIGGAIVFLTILRAIIFCVIDIRG